MGQSHQEFKRHHVHKNHLNSFQRSCGALDYVLMLNTTLNMERERLSLQIILLPAMLEVNKIRPARLFFIPNFSVWHQGGGGGVCNA